MDYPDHLKFFAKLRKAQKTANGNGKRAQICWRGHRTSVTPKQGNGRLQKKDLLQKLVNALKSIRNIKDNEKKVLFYV